MEARKVSVNKLADILKPFETSPPAWGKTIVSRNEIDRALSSIDLLAPERKLKSRQDHIRRIAWYAAYGFSSPVQLKADGKSVKVIDGEHQLRAAIVRGDNVINIVVDGDLSEILPN